MADGLNRFSKACAAMWGQTAIGLVALATILSGSAVASYVGGVRPKHPVSGGFDAGLRPAPPAILLGPRAVWAKGSQKFHPLGKAMASSSFSRVRVSTEMSQDSGDCKIRPAVRFSGDGVSWGPDKELDGVWMLQDGVTYGEAYVDLMALALTPPKTYIQFGVQVANEAGVDLCFPTQHFESRRNESDNHSPQRIREASRVGAFAACHDNSLIKRSTSTRDTIKQSESLRRGQYRDCPSLRLPDAEGPVGARMAHRCDADCPVDRAGPPGHRAVANFGGRDDRWDLSGGGAFPVVGSPLSVPVVRVRAG